MVSILEETLQLAGQLSAADQKKVRDYTLKLLKEEKDSQSRVHSLKNDLQNQWKYDLQDDSISSMFSELRIG